MDNNLGSSNFGFTDPLTGTWRPKKGFFLVAEGTTYNNGTVWSRNPFLNGTTGTMKTNADKGFDGLFILMVVSERIQTF